MSSDYLKVVFLDDELQGGDSHKYRLTPFLAPNTEIFFSGIKEAQKLTHHRDVKVVYKLSFDSKIVKHDFRAGDTIGILPSNNEGAIEKILTRLNLLSVADKPCQLQVLEGTTKKNATIPKHLPHRTTLREIFFNHVDIHSPPKKTFLKSLIKFTHDSPQRSTLEQISSPKASQEYTNFITTSGKTLQGLLETFPSCQPPVEVLLQHLPPLTPRPYSISSSPVCDNLEITFFVLVHEDTGRKGLCTGWLENLVEQKSNVLVPFYYRQPTKFRLDEDLSVPVILIATGTGIAPFRGFLQHVKKTQVSMKIWLFYGCRYSDKDFLFKEEIEDLFKNEVITRLDTSFSREGQNKTYVQDNIEKKGEDLCKWILGDNAKIFVCGDVKTMVKDVRKCIGSVCVTYGNVNIDGDTFMKGLELDGRFVVDSWL